ncbi:TCP-1/cpn60 chaperonin family protein [Candidatus Woesearchaeota archaeon]|nr:TCP-1/cpn60 chaperonin family protein [Candidatus Woesearchaeota archaeon]
MNNSNQQNQLLNEGTSRDQGRTAQRMNILAAKLVAETVRTTLGPQGMDKMIVDSLGEVVITNDGATILREMNIEHPTAKMIVEIAKTQEHEVGDGTTTAVVLAGELLRQAEELLEQNIHPTVIIKGYRMAARTAAKVLENVSEDIGKQETTILKNIAMTSITGKVAENAKEHLANIVVQAIKQVVDETVDLENIKLETKTGSGVDNTELIKGIVLDKEKTHNNMPTVVDKARIALIDAALEIQSTDTDSKISITDPSKLQEFLDMEENMLRKIVDKIASSGANVVFCQKGIDDFVQYLLAQKGIYACRRVKKSDLKKLAKATQGTIITNVKDLSKEHLGTAGKVSEVEINEEPMTIIAECKNPKAVTILIRASTEHLVDEVKRAIEDALGTVASAIKAKKIVAGAGAIEIELARNIKHYSSKLSGKEQLAVEAFAKSMEIIPKTLAENAGLDPIDVLTELRAAHDRGEKWAGLDVYSGKTLDAMKKGIVEPLPVKTQAVASASEVAVMILRIDDVIIAGNEPSQGRPNPGEGFE